MESGVWKHISFAPRGFFVADVAVRVFIRPADVARARVVDGAANERLNSGRG